MKIVLDTSVLIAAFYRPIAGPSFSKDVFDHLTSSDEEIYVSPYILKEFVEKCVKKLGVARTTAQTFEKILVKKLRVHTPQADLPDQTEFHSLRDAKDRPILDLAVSVKADFVLTWDKDLLVLRSIGTARIVTPRQFWDATSGL